MTKRGGTIIFCRILAPPQCPPSLYATILIYPERGGTIIFCRLLPPPQCPPPHSPDATMLIYLNDREGAPLSFVGFSAPQRPPPPRRHNT